MATPTASPQVSSTVGLKNVVIAPLTKDTETEHTYGALQLMGAQSKRPSPLKTLIRTCSTPTMWNSTCCTPILN